MSSTLATRCPSCSTVFRVVPDQLRVSEGWVRCGRCSEVFNAAEALIDMETGAPRRWEGDGPRRPAAAAPTDAARGRGRAAPGLAPLAPVDPAPDGDADAPSDADAASDAAPSGRTHDGAAARPGAPEPAGNADAAPVLTAAASDRQLEPHPALDDDATPGAGAAALPDLRADGPPDHRIPSPGRAAAKGAQPSFLRQAERAARWQRPRVRAALALAALALTLALALQVGGTYRDLAAARFPQLAPLLAQGCAWLGCRLEPARAIASLEVESSGLVRVEASSVYRLQVALRNRAGIDLALPALDLALSDSRGRLVARRVLTAAELGAETATIAAGSALLLRASLQAGLQADEPVAGYTIALFYP